MNQQQQQQQLQGMCSAALAKCLHAPCALLACCCQDHEQQQQQQLQGAEMHIVYLCTARRAVARSCPVYNASLFWQAGEQAAGAFCKKRAHHWLSCFLTVQHGNATAPAWPVCTASLLLQGAWYWSSSSSCRCKSMHACRLYHRICTAACTLRRVELHMSTPH
jgi:hypothetical protein